MPIRDVSIAGVRGINLSVRFDLRGQSLLLHGDNGTGKSSFERALRWALRGEEEPTADAPFTTAESFRRHIKAGADHPSVVVSFIDGSTIAVRPGSFVATGNGAAIRDACITGQPFLRRSELLTVLGARPGERFAYFETFLGLQHVDRLIEEISARRSATQGRVTALTSKLDAALEPLRALLPDRLAAKETLPELVAAAEAWARALSLSAATELERIEELRARVASLSSGAANSFPYRLQEANAAITVARESLDASARLIPELLRREEEAGSSLTDSGELELLSHALEHFRHESGEACPVCGQPVIWTQTRNFLESRVMALESYSQVKRELANLASAVRNSAVQLESALRDAAGVAAALGVAGTYPFTLPAEVGPLTASSTPNQVPEAPLAGWRKGIAAAIVRCQTAASDILAVEALIPDTRHLPELQTAATFYKRLSDVRPSAELIRAEREALDKESSSLGAVVEALRRSRQDVAKETLTAIEGLVSAYYFKIHPPGTPDDATGAPSIDVQRHGRGTAFVRGEFGGTEVKDPTWVYSDGHLDTVGLCIFLALRRFRSAQSGDPKVMVLDDVIISIDLGHSRRFLELLKAEFADHQVLILTHNGLFAHWSKTLLPGLTRLEIKGWSLDAGPKIGDYSSARDRVNGALANGTAKEIAMALMDLLDEWTVEARYEYQVAVPAKAGEQYTLTEIWEPLCVRLKKIAKVLKSDLSGIVGLLDALRDVPQVRNALAGHHNEFAQEYPRSVIAAIATDACKLIDGLYCRDCAAFVIPVGNRSTPSLMECPGHHKLHLATAKGVT